MAKQAAHPNLNEGGNEGNAYGAGRKPANRIVTQELETLLGEIGGNGRSRRLNARRLADAILRHALAGNGAYLKALLDRVEGPMTQRLEVEDVTELSDDERAERTLALLERARARRDGPAAGD